AAGHRGGQLGVGALAESPYQRRQHGLLGGEVVQQSTLGHAGLRGDRADRDLAGVAVGQQALQGVQDPVGRARFGRARFGHEPTIPSGRSGDRLAGDRPDGRSAIRVAGGDVMSTSGTDNNMETESSMDTDTTDTTDTTD